MPFSGAARVRPKAVERYALHLSAEWASWRPVFSSKNFITWLGPFSGPPPVPLAYAGSHRPVCPVSGWTIAPHRRAVTAALSQGPRFAPSALFDTLYSVDCTL
jgi:hypothetical protein